jgi:hypothetical protein
LAEMLPNALTVLADHGEARSDPGVSWAMAPASESSH